MIYRNDSSLIFPNGGKMFIVHVHVNVRPEKVEDFITATKDNAKNSSLEPGVIRFDVIQNEDDGTKFVLVEVYKNQEASGAHKDTRHYRIWRNTVNDMMAEPRESVRYKNIYPPEGEWK
jgi:(4S)-4-hydroxy-5-phosphonooxypentane-2,3-dione isomerase